jgi:hypothetical protein
MWSSALVTAPLEAIAVNRKGQGPVLTTVDEFYKVGPGPLRVHGQFCDSYEYGGGVSGTSFRPNDSGSTLSSSGSTKLLIAGPLLRIPRG